MKRVEWLVGWLVTSWLNGKWKSKHGWQVLYVLKSVQQVSTFSQVIVLLLQISQYTMTVGNNLHKQWLLVTISIYNDFLVIISIYNTQYGDSWWPGGWKGTCMPSLSSAPWTRRRQVSPLFSFVFCPPTNVVIQKKIVVSHDGIL